MSLKFMMVDAVPTSRFSIAVEPEGGSQVKQGRHSNWLLWAVFAVFTFAMMLATHTFDAPGKLGRMGSTTIGDSAGLYDQGQATRQVGFLMVGGLGGLLLIRQGDRRLTPTRLGFGILVALLAWIAISPLWSTDLAITFKRLIVFICVALVILGILKTFPLRNVLAGFLVACGLVCVAGILNEARYGFAGINSSGYRFAGTVLPNQAAVNGALLTLLSIYGLGRFKNRWLWVPLVLGVIIVLLTRSRTSLAAMAVMLGVYFALTHSARRVTAAGIGVAILAAGLLIVSSLGQVKGVSGALSMGRSDAAKSAETLTGRTDIWYWSLAPFRQDPSRLLTGFGYDSYWTTQRMTFVSQRVGFPIGEGHNAYIELVLNLGLLGAAMAVTLLIGALVFWSRTALRTGSTTAAVMASLLVFGMVQALAESMLAKPTLWTLLLWLPVVAAILRPRPSGPQLD